MQQIPVVRWITIAMLLVSSNLLNAQKKMLDHSVYDGWKSLTGANISSDGKISAALISPQEGDTTLMIRNNVTNKSIEVERVSKYTLSPDGKYTVGLVKAPFTERRQARIDKKKAEDAPKDSLVIVDNATFSMQKIADVKAFKAPREISKHIAYTVEAAKDTTDKSKVKEKDLLIVRNLETGKEDTIRNTKISVFNRYGNAFAATIEPDKKDTTDTRRVVFYDLTAGEIQDISRDSLEYKSLSFDEAGRQLVYIATGDTSKIEQKTYDVRYFKIGADSATIIADKHAEGLPEGWIFSENASPAFSKSGNRIIIGSAPKQAPKDTAIVDFEMATLDIWSWHDPVVQPQQLAELKRELSRTYTGIINPQNPDNYLLLANEEMPYCNISNESDGRYALLYSSLPYLIETQWDISAKNDVWIYDLQENRLTELAKAMKGRPMLSAKGNYTLWWNGEEKQWYAYNNSSGETANLTANIGVNFWNEKNDTPSLPGPYGIAGWAQNDRYVFLNDAFDIWKIDPNGVEKPLNITQEAGRKDSLTFRYINTDPDKRFIEPKDVLLLSAFDNVSKEKGYYTLKQKGRKPLVKHITDKFNFTGLIKAKNAEAYLFQKSNFSTSPDLYFTDNLWKTSTKFTDINPQMRDYNWGTAEMFSWTSFAGVPLQGIVYKPEDFDPAKQYPVMIYFYEQHSDNLYNYFTPAPSRSTVNIPFFVSRGYIVFTPDIHYTVGHPGNDAYNAVVSGAEALAENSWVDKENMAIQGQSWGGYQVAYLVTRTDMFKAAGSGAPVSNMTSAYGGIRWESGRSRQFQYEQTQSRIGATMMDSLDLYIENSPVFFADKVNTPLLIMHNDNDGAVPWYQGIEYFMALRRLQKPVWMLQYNKEAHNLIHRRNSKDLSIRLQQFFDHYLKDEPAPSWMKNGLRATDKGKSWGYELE